MGSFPALGAISYNHRLDRVDRNYAVHFTTSFKTFVSHPCVLLCQDYLLYDKNWQLKDRVISVKEIRSCAVRVCLPCSICLFLWFYETSRHGVTWAEMTAIFIPVTHYFLSFQLAFFCPHLLWDTTSQPAELAIPFMTFSLNCHLLSLMKLSSPQQGCVHSFVFTSLSLCASTRRSFTGARDLQETVSFGQLRVMRSCNISRLVVQQIEKCVSLGFESIIHGWQQCACAVVEDVKTPGEGETTGPRPSDPFIFLLWLHIQQTHVGSEP